MTPPGKANNAWGTLLRQGRGRGITVYGITQSPAESDKTIVRNANRFHVCRLGTVPDRRTMEKTIDLPAGSLDKLTATAKAGAFVEYDGLVHQWGVMRFRDRAISYGNGPELA